MKKNQLLILGLVLLFLGPLYQGFDALLRNTDGDGVIVYGKYTIYRPFIGYKAEHFHMGYDYDGWQKDYTVFYTPAWMKLLGVEETVTYSNSEKNESSFVQRTLSFLLRWGMKIIIPGIFFFLYYRKKEIRDDRVYGDLFI